jgi:hypothetical protein
MQQSAENTLFSIKLSKHLQLNVCKASDVNAVEQPSISAVVLVVGAPKDVKTFTAKCV